MIKFDDIPPEGIDIPGPVDWEGTSHGLEYDYENFTVQTWGRMGDKTKFRIMTRIRRMVGSEIIHTKLRGHSRDEILKAYGVDEEEQKAIWIRFGHRQRIIHGLTIFNVIVIVAHIFVYVIGLLKI
jgi:predicted Fe-S protein YdhL (DUF1289 family)